MISRVHSRDESGSDSDDEQKHARAKHRRRVVRAPIESAATGPLGMIARFANIRIPRLAALSSQMDRRVRDMDTALKGFVDLTGLKLGSAPLRVVENITGAKISRKQFTAFQEFLSGKFTDRRTHRHEIQELVVIEDETPDPVRFKIISMYHLKRLQVAHRAVYPLDYRYPDLYPAIESLQVVALDEESRSGWLAYIGLAREPRVGRDHDSRITDISFWTAMWTGQEGLSFRSLVAPPNIRRIVLGFQDTEAGTDPDSPVVDEPEELVPLSMNSLRELLASPTLRELHIFGHMELDADGVQEIVAWINRGDGRVITIASIADRDDVLGPHRGRIGQPDMGLLPSADLWPQAPSFSDWVLG